MTVSEAFQIAVRHHQGGRLTEAEALYRQILATQPNHAGASHLFGVIAHQVGRHDIAVEWIGRAIALDPSDPFAHSNLGEAYRAIGRSGEAIASFQRALQINPGWAEAHNRLGNVLRERGELEGAVAAYQRALQLNPGYPEAHYNLGNVLRESGRLEDAAEAYRHALELKPDFPEAQNNLGNALKDLRRLEEAIAVFRHALECRPDFLEVHVNLGNTLRERGELVEAIAAYRRAIEIKPDCEEAHNNLGNAFKDLGQFEEAMVVYRQALRIRPDSAEAHHNLGNALQEQGQLEEAMAEYSRALAIKPDLPETLNNLGNVLRDRRELGESVAAYRRALEIRPDYPEALNNLSNALKERGQLDEAIEVFHRALELKPDYPEAFNNLGNALRDQGRMDEAIDAFRRALELGPGDARFHSNLVYTLHFHPGFDRRSIEEEEWRWNRQCGEPLRRYISPHTNDRSAERKLRVGYVSPNFRDHVVGRNLAPLFEHHDRERFEILCYSGVQKSDAITERFRGMSQTWRRTTGVSDAQLAEVIRADGVDILVDLTQHMAGNRLPMFARRPAPVQISFAGYPERTGLEAIEYRISDRHLHVDSREKGLVGKEDVRLIDSFWCYDPCGIKVDINPPPAAKHGFITFGCLNNFCKVNEQVLNLWAQALRSVKNSRLVISSAVGCHRKRVLDVLEREGVKASRVDFVDLLTRSEYLELYHRLDIVLDTFPYNGHTTSLDALWMGVPVVSLAGDTPVSRAGLSQLTNLGLSELIAHTGMDYVHIAEKLAGDLPRLAQLRSRLRDRMENSVLMDAPRFARQVEQAYREIWRAWCAGK